MANVCKSAIGSESGIAYPLARKSEYMSVAGKPKITTCCQVSLPGNNILAETTASVGSRSRYTKCTHIKPLTNIFIR
jgi:hypothetical protein